MPPSSSGAAGCPDLRPQSCGRVIRNAPPARIGKSLPQFAPSRSAAPDIVRGLPPSVQGSAPAPSVRPGEINRFPASGGVRERAPVSAKYNVVQPPVRQDPNPVADGQGDTVAAGPASTTAPGAAATVRRAAGQVSPNPALREPGIPMPKDRGTMQRPAVVEQPAQHREPSSATSAASPCNPALQPPSAPPTPVAPHAEQRPGAAEACRRPSKHHHQSRCRNASQPLSRRALHRTDCNRRRSAASSRTVSSGSSCPIQDNGCAEAADGQGKPGVQVLFGS